MMLDAVDLSKTLGELKKVVAFCFTPDSRSIIVLNELIATQIREVTPNRGGVRVYSPDLAIQDLSPWPRILDEAGLIAISPDGQLALFRDTGNWMRLSSIAARRMIGQPFHSDGGVVQMAFTPDGSSAITISSVGRCSVWDLAGMLGGGQVVLPHFDRSVSVVRPPPTGVVYLPAHVIERESATRAWRGSGTWRPSRPSDRRFVHQGGILAARFSPDGKTLLTGSGNGNDLALARLWDAATGQPLGPALPHHGEVLSVDFSPDGSTAVTASLDGAVRFWDVESGGNPVSKPIVTGNGAVFAVRFLHDGRSILTANRFGGVWLIDVETRKPILPLMLHDQLVPSVDVTPDGRVALTFCIDNLRCWDLTTGRLLTESLTDIFGVISLASDGQSALIRDPADDAVSLYEIPSLIRKGKALKHRSRVVGVALTADGRRAATCCWDGSLWTWDMASRRPLGPAIPIGEGVGQVDFTPDGTRIIAWCADNTVRIVTPPEPESGSLAEARRRAVRTTGVTLTPEYSIELIDREAHDRSDVLPERSPMKSPPSRRSGPTRPWLTATGSRHFSISAHSTSRRPTPGLGSAGSCALVLIGKMAQADAEIRLLLEAKDSRFARDALAYDSFQFENRTSVTPDAHKHGERPNYSTALWYLDRLIGPECTDGRLRMRRAALLAMIGRTYEAAKELDLAVEQGVSFSDLDQVFKQNLVRFDHWGVEPSIPPKDDTLRRAGRILVFPRDGPASHGRSGRIPRDLLRAPWPDCPRSRSVGFRPMSMPGSSLSGPTLGTSAARSPTRNSPSRTARRTRRERHAALNTLGILLYRAGRDEEAIAKLNESLAVPDGNWEVLDHVFLALRTAGLGVPTRRKPT